jgi:hypothetical protein
MDKATAPEYIGWRFIADGHRQGFYDKRLIDPSDWLEDGALPDDHPAWIEEEDL